MLKTEQRNRGVDFVANLSNNILHLLEKMTSGRRWIIYATLLAVAFSLIQAFPSRELWDLSSSRAQAVTSMMGDLDAFWRNLSAQSSIHDRVIAYRVTIPLISSLTGLSLSGAYIVQAAVGIALLGAVTILGFRCTGDRVCATLLGLSVATIWAGQSAFVSHYPFFDAYALLFLMLAMLVRQPILIVLSLVLAAFTDERALVASGFVFLWWIATERTAFNTSGDANTDVAKGRRFPWRAVSVVLAVLAYLTIRSAIQRHYQLRTETSNFEFGKLINNSAFATWTAFEGAWILVGLALIILALRRQWMFLVTFCSIMFIGILGSTSITDMTRSMAYLLPGLILALYVVAQDTDTKTLRKLSLVATTICVLWPAYYAGGKSTIWWHYPLPLQLVRMVTGAGGNSGAVDVNP